MLISFSGKKQMAVVGMNSASVPGTLVSRWAEMFAVCSYGCGTQGFEHPLTWWIGQGDELSSRLP